MSVTVEQVTRLIELEKKARVWISIIAEEMEQMRLTDDLLPDLADSWIEMRKRNEELEGQLVESIADDTRYEALVRLKLEKEHREQLSTERKRVIELVENEVNLQIRQGNADDTFVSGRLHGLRRVLYLLSHETPTSRLAEKEPAQ